MKNQRHGEKCRMGSSRIVGKYLYPEWDIFGLYKKVNE